MPLRVWTGSFMKSSFDRLADFNNKVKPEDCMWMPTNDLNTVLDVNWAHFKNFEVNNKWICRKSSLPSPAIKQWTGSNLQKPKIRLYTEFQHTLRSFNCDLVNLTAIQAYWRTGKAYDSCRHSLRISFWYLEFPRIQLQAAKNFLLITSTSIDKVWAFNYSCT